MTQYSVPLPVSRSVTDVLILLWGCGWDREIHAQVGAGKQGRGSNCRFVRA
jgi:uncharacterized membrane protein